MSIPKALAHPFFDKLLRWTLLCLVLYGLVYFMATLSGRVFFRYSWDYGEPVVANAVYQLTENPLIYASYEEYPFRLVPYNPVYIYLSYFMTLLAGETLAAGRLVAFLSLIGVSGVLYRMYRLGELPRLTAALFALLPFVIPGVAAYAAQFKMDLTALFFELAGLYCMMRFEKKPETNPGKAYVFGILFFTLAFFTKQSYIFGVAAYGLFLLLRRRFLEGAVFGTVMAACVALPMFLLNAMTGGFYFKHTLLANMLEYYWLLVVRAWKRYLLATGGLLVPALWWVGRDFRKRRFSLYGLYFCATAAASLLIGKIGSNDNYFIPLTVASSLLAGFLWDAAGRWEGWQKIAGQCLKIVLLVQLGLLVAQPFQWFSRAESEAMAEARGFNEITRIVGLMRGEVITDSMSFLLEAGKPIVYEPFEFSQLARQGMWDEEKILSRLRDKEFSLALLSVNIWQYRQTERFTWDFIRTLREHYRLYGATNGFFFYIPAEER